MASSPTRVDSSLIKWVMVYLVVVLAALLIAEAITDGDSSPLLAQIIGVATPIGALLILGVKGGDVAQQGLAQGKAIEDKTDVQTSKLEKIEHAVNGKMDSRFRALEDGHATLVNELGTVKSDIADIRDMLKRVLQ